MTLYRISGGRACRVVHDIPMTHRAGNAEDPAGRPEDGKGGTDAAGGAAGADGATVSSVPFGAWPSPIEAAEVGRGRLRIAYPKVIGGDVWWQEGRPEYGEQHTDTAPGHFGLLSRGSEVFAQPLRFLFCQFGLPFFGVELSQQ